MKGGRKYAKEVNAGDGHMMAGGGGSMAGMKSRSYGSGEPSGPKTGKTMSGAKGGASQGAPGKALNTQGEKAGGISAGRSRTMSGTNRSGAGRQQTTRG